MSENLFVLMVFVGLAGLDDCCFQDANRESFAKFKFLYPPKNLRTIPLSRPFFSLQKSGKLHRKWWVFQPNMYQLDPWKRLGWVPMKHFLRDPAATLRLCDQWFRSEFWTFFCIYRVFFGSSKWRQWKAAFEGKTGSLGEKKITRQEWPFFKRSRREFATGHHIWSICWWCGQLG